MLRALTPQQAARAAGAKPYTPLPPAMTTQLQLPKPETARLEARKAEFLRLLDADVERERARGRHSEASHRAAGSARAVEHTEPSSPRRGLGAASATGSSGDAATGGLYSRFKSSGRTMAT